MKRKLPTLSIAALLAGAIGMSAASPDFPRVTSQFPSWPATAPSQKPHVGGMFGGLKRKNPFRGIACPVVSSDDERHIEGERDTLSLIHI